MKINFTTVFIVYYIFCAFVLYGLYNIIFVLHESKWWLLMLLVLSMSPSYKETDDL